MLRVDLVHAKPGMTLALPVQNPRSPDRVLLKRGYELTGETLTKLKDHEVRSLWVRYPSLDFLEDLICPAIVGAQQQVLSHITEAFGQLQQGAAAKIRYADYTKSITQLVEQLLTHPQAALFLGDIDHASDDLMRHSSAVAYLSLLIGLKLEGYLVKERKHVDPGRAKEVCSLGLGAMLHDMGVLTLPAEVRTRFRETGDEADPAWREHTVEGWRLARGKIDASAAAVILHHHQRYDGRGFAGADMPVLEGHRIHVFARIVAVADAFDRLRNPMEGVRRPTVGALREILGESHRGAFDPLALQALVEVTPPYAPGSTVRLSDGRWAVAIDHHPDQPCRPTVQIIPDPATLSMIDPPTGETIDLRQASPTLFVAEAEDADVSRMNFPPPRLDPTARAAA